MATTTVNTTLTSGSTVVDQIKSITWSSKRNGADVTVLEDPPVIRMFPGTLDPGTFSGSIVFDPTNVAHQQVLTKLKDKPLEWHQMTLSDGTNIRAMGFVSSLSPKADSGVGALEADYEIQLTGSVVINSGFGFGFDGSFS